MAKKVKGEYLFRELHKARYGEGRRTRPLFLPNILKQETKSVHHEWSNLDYAYDIFVKWADIESAGKLDPRKETTLESEFITQIFGQALGYTLFSEDKSEWNLEPKFTANGGIADAAIGVFDNNQKRMPQAVIELKDSTVNVDKDRFGGRTPVQQCWDYLNALPECPWGIVCNYVSFRLYHRNNTPKVYEIFTLQELRDKDVFKQFYYIFEKQGFISQFGKTPRTEFLLRQTVNRQREVGDELYQYYHDNRQALISRLTKPPYSKPLDDAIRITQKLIDRIIFVAFCEDRELLPENSIGIAWEQLPAFFRVTNPRWQNFLNLFHHIDKGNERNGIPGYNGGLFRQDDEVDNLQLDDEWTDFFKHIGAYEFRYEINVDILGKLFEKSINDIEKVRLTGFFEAKSDKPQPKMSKSAERKKEGVYYTPPEFTEFIAYNAIDKLIDERLKPAAEKYGLDYEDPQKTKDQKKLAQYVNDAVEIIRQVKAVDPACGSGAFLIQAYQVFEEKYLDIAYLMGLYDDSEADKFKDLIPDYILHDNVYGVDLSPAAVEIAQLALWLQSAHRGKTLADLSKNVVCGNSLVSDVNVHPRALNWQEKFPEVFNRENPGFDCVIGNPPWERLKLQEREFFDSTDSAIASAVNAAKRRQLIEKLQKNNPELNQKYITAKEDTEKILNYIRTCGKYSLTGRGDINTYAVFAELAKNIVSPVGRIGLLVPSGIATDNTTKDFFAELTKSNLLAALYDFENKAPAFPDVH
ncbi:MAG: DNA methyltransferase, partial [Kiritimatiellales bacterium]